MSELLILKFSTASVKSATIDKPNEDACLLSTEANCFSVADGVSRLRRDDGTYPVGNLAGRVAQLVCTKAIEAFTAQQDSKLRIEQTFLKEVIKNVNQAIMCLNTQEVPNYDFGDHDLGAAAALVGSVHETHLSLVQIGDCMCFSLDYQDKLNCHTYNQTKSIEEYIRKVGNSRELQKQIRSNFRNNKNEPLSWGALTGEAKALDFLQFQEVELSRLKRVFVLSDGALLAFDRNLEVLREGTALQILQEIQDVETKNQLSSDDKTMIVMDINI